MIDKFNFSELQDIAKLLSGRITNRQTGVSSPIMMTDYVGAVIKDAIKDALQSSSDKKEAIYHIISELPILSASLLEVVKIECPELEDTTSKMLILK